jgi:hypothetical protein
VRVVAQNSVTKGLAPFKLEILRTAGVAGNPANGDWCGD